MLMLLLLLYLEAQEQCVFFHGDWLLRGIQLGLAAIPMFQRIEKAETKRHSKSKQTVLFLHVRL